MTSIVDVKDQGKVKEHTMIYVTHRPWALKLLIWSREVLQHLSMKPYLALLLINPLMHCEVSIC